MSGRERKRAARGKVCKFSVLSLHVWLTRTHRNNSKILNELVKVGTMRAGKEKGASRGKLNTMEIESAWIESNKLDCIRTG